MLVAWKRKIFSMHRWRTPDKPALKPTLGDSISSQQAAVASGWPSPLMAITSGDVKKEGVGRSSKVEFQTSTIKGVVVKGWTLINRQYHFAEKDVRSQAWSPLCGRNSF